MLKILHGHIGYHHHQNDYRIEAYLDGKIVGYLDYSEFEGVNQIMMIEVAKDQKRQGIASAMFDRLLKETGCEFGEIDWGGMTPSGSELYRAMERKYDPEASQYSSRQKEEEEDFDMSHGNKLRLLF